MFYKALDICLIAFAAVITYYACRGFFLGAWPI